MLETEIKDGQKKKNLWSLLDQLRHYTSITDMDHANMSYEFIKEQVKSSRNLWKACKKKSAATRLAFFSDRADLMAMKL